MSYRVEGLGETVTFESGSNLLLTGESSQIDERLLEVVAPGSDERTVVITANVDVETVVKELESHGADRARLGVIDCTTRDTEVEGVELRRLDSPGDLTGISLEFAKLFGEEHEFPVRIAMSSISTMLMYTELRKLFRFLHVFTARIRSGGMFGVFAMDPGMHEEQTVNTVRAIFDAEAHIDDAGSVSLEGSGFSR